MSTEPHLTSFAQPWLTGNTGPTGTGEMANGQVQIVGSETVSPGSLTNQFQGRKRWRRKLGSKRGSRDLSWIHTSAKRYKNYGTRDTWQLEPRLLFDMEELLWLSVVTIFQLCLKCLSFTNDTDMPMVGMIRLRLVSAAPREGVRWGLK